MRLYEKEIQDYVKEQNEITSAWFGGSKATGREDHLSDIDLVLVSANADQTFSHFEQFLNQISSIDLIHKEKRRSNFDQRFYVLKQTSESYYLDVCIFESQEEKDYAEFFNHDRHGTPVIIKDSGLLLKAKQLSQKLTVNLDKEYLKGRAEIFYRTFLKEAQREKFIDAYHFYLALIQIWTTIVRTKSCPQKHDFSLRYINIDLDLDHALFLENQLKISSLIDLKVKALTLKKSIDKELQ